ncbi:hypothetical protein ZWY2020_021152 [Hordeum vulgare]|nr:hypothetical protein ZWY2020_021152 [Hordeum vulgare]
MASPRLLRVLWSPPPCLRRPAMARPDLALGLPDPSSLEPLPAPAAPRRRAPGLPHHPVSVPFPRAPPCRPPGRARPRAPPVLASSRHGSSCPRWLALQQGLPACPMLVLPVAGLLASAGAAPPWLSHAAAALGLASVVRSTVPRCVELACHRFAIARAAARVLLLLLSR